MARSNIEWTEVTWNPTTGCTKISDGCVFCYAQPLSLRLKAMGLEKYRNGFKLTVHPDELKRPYTWKGSKIVFVNSMSDLFHHEVPDNFIKQVFRIMNDTPQHNYQLLTKRAERLTKIADQLIWSENIWMGVSVENEKVIKRIEHLTNTPAAIKFISFEPLIGPVLSLEDYINELDWVIVGGESGTGARPIEKHWIDSIKKVCHDYNTPFFFKQWGRKKFNINNDDPTMNTSHPFHAKGGCQLDGKIYREMPVIEF
ncbi:MAG: phage Gp37/Gp68 family protein [Chlorobi bacterium]|nr:phage Gp37/Gp68 family protein [Chlorobiota bacterium]